MPDPRRRARRGDDHRRAAQARTIESIDGPAAAARQAEIEVAAMNFYLKLKGQKAGSIRGQAAPTTTDARKKS